jgi:DnaJ-class molecular chaperone
MTYYDILQIPADANEAMIRSAFRRLARLYHPDAGTGSSPEKFRELFEAYGVLIDSPQRAAYDESLTRASRRVPIHVEQLERRVASAEPLAQPNRAFASSGINELRSLMFELVFSLPQDFFLDDLFPRFFSR